MKNKNENYPIDFVVLWVDGSDPKWLAKKKQYKPELNIADEEARYRDWGIFKYWFRAVEKYAPWVNHVYLVTDNQKPSWIDEKNPKLTIVDHTEIIDKKYLPTFNSQAIEMNLHKIPGLSEHFVYFNDDMYLGRGTDVHDFFREGKPVDSAIINAATGMSDNELFAKSMFNDALIINRHFKKKTVLKNGFFKWLNPKYGKENIRTFSQLIYPYFTGYKPSHMPTPMLKSTYVTLWRTEEKTLRNTTSHRFRHADDVNQFLISWWQICSGYFMPKSLHDAKYVELNPNNLSSCKKIIKSSKYKELCLNDCWGNTDASEARKTIIDAFEQKFNSKSSFEK